MEVEMKQGSRLGYVDFIRGMAMLTVVFVHTRLEAVLPDWTNYFASFHMFLFFFISGFLFNKDRAADFEAYGKKQAMRLMLPYIVFSAVNWYLNAERGETTESLMGNLVHANLTYGAIWFLPAMFICCMAGGYILTKSKSDIVSIALSLLCLAGGYGLVFGLGFHFLRIPQGLCGVFFFVAGYLFRKWEQRLNAKYRILLGLAAIALGLVISHFNTPVHFSHMMLGCIPLTLTGALCTIIGLFLVSQKLGESNPISAYVAFIGRNSMTVLCTHIYIIDFVNEIYKPRLNAVRILSLDYIFVLIFAMIVQTIVVLLWNGAKDRWKGFISLQR